MAKELNARKLEHNGIIEAATYLRGSFFKCERYDVKCENCNQKRNHYHVYLSRVGTLIRICFFCKKKVSLN